MLHDHALFPSGAHSSSGRAAYQHDRHLVHHQSNRSVHLVADGHGSAPSGHLVSQHITDHFPTVLHRHIRRVYHPHSMRTALRNAVLDLDRSAIQATSAARLYAGSTLCALVRVHGFMYCINVGDSRAVLICSDHVRQLSVDHRCHVPRERYRIERAGGFVVGGMLNGYISMSRAIGDDDLKTHRNITHFPAIDVSQHHRYGEELFIAEPDIHCFSVDVSDLVCVIASDGVWDKLGNEQVMKIVRKHVSKRRSADSIAKQIVKRAIAKGSKDNVTALVTFLWPYDHVLKAFSSSRLRKRRAVNVSLTKKNVLDARFDERVESSISGSVDGERVTAMATSSHWHRDDERKHVAERSALGRFAAMRGRLADAWQSRSISTMY